MSQVFSCDFGCGATTARADEFQNRGFTGKNCYCPKCLEMVDQYLVARDELHTRVAREFTFELLKLQQIYRPPNGRLPDE
jgi:hypothetical protein